MREDSSDDPQVRTQRRKSARLVGSVLFIAAWGNVAAACGNGNAADSSGEPGVLAAQSSETSNPDQNTSSGGLQAEAAPGTTTAPPPETSAPTTVADGLRSRTDEADGTTSQPESAPVSLPEGSEEFTDLEGQWLMSIDPGWSPSHGTVQDEVELWFLPGSGVSFADNVNVLTQQNTLDVGIERYLDISLASAESVFDDFVLLDDRFRTGSHGQQQGVLEYTATLEGMNLHFYQVLVLNDDIAVVVTMASPDERFEDRRDEVEEHLRTLRLIESS